MPDITMCAGKDCPLRDTCHRHLATPSEYRQSYFLTAPYDPHTQRCEHYWPSEVS